MEVYYGRGSRNRILSDEQIHQVNEYALRLIEEAGCGVQCKEALDILGRAGCDVQDSSRVRIPRRLVLEALDAAPKAIEVYNRDGELAMRLESDHCYYGTGSDCPTTIDLDTGQRRASTKDDVGRLARFCDALPNIDFVMSFAIAQDVTAGGDFVHGYEAMLLNTHKPVIVTGHGPNDMTTMIRMAAAARGNLDEFKRTPSMILYTEPISPLFHSEMGVSKGLVCCEYGVPFIYIGSPMMGATAPVTMEGTLVQAVAECLSGLVIFQQKRPGAKFIFGGDATLMDMGAMVFSYGSPELNMLNAALADLAHFYELPFFCIAGATDSKVLDAQAGMEYALSILGATLNGCNLIHDCGYLESGLTSSFESVLFADELISEVKYMMQPLRFDDSTVPLRLMSEVGPGGSFLETEQTLERFRQSMWFPRFLDRRRYEAWSEDGGQDLRQVLNARAIEISQEHNPEPLSEDRVRAIRELVALHRPDIE
jgi:trimethylamine---corrinoid protein Co-methyltransferase